MSMPRKTDKGYKMKEALHRHPHRITWIILGICAIGVAMTAATVHNLPENSHTPSLKATTSNTRNWKHDIKSASANASSEPAYRILLDGKITEGELSEVKHQFVNCVTNLGISNIQVHEDGTVEFPTPDDFTEQTSRQIDLCGNSTGFDEVMAWNNATK